MRLGAVCSVFRKGIFDIKASSYAEVGVPFVRIGNIRNGLIDSNDIALITPEAHTAEGNTALKFGDIVLSKTAYAAAAFVNLPDCNVSQDTIAIKLSSYGLKQFKSGYIVAYLNSRYGLALMSRQFQGNVQEHLSLPDGQKVLVPLLSKELQAKTDRSLRDANEKLQIADQKIEAATNSLVAALGLSQWHPAEPLTYVRQASEAFAAGRLDSQYFAPRVAELLIRLGSGGRSVGDAAPPRRERFAPAESGTFRYMEISDLRSDGTAATEVVQMREAPSRATWYARKGDVVTSTVRPNRRLSALLSPDQDGCVASSGFVVLQPKLVQAEVLLTYLRLPVFCELMDLHTSASLYPAISDSDLLTLPFPEIPQAASNEIVSAVRAAHSAREQAHSLLAQAKRAVEIAIEDSEVAALKFLKEN
jgi:restriction endonuclease S subunit